MKINKEEKLVSIYFTLESILVESLDSSTKTKSIFNNQNQIIFENKNLILESNIRTRLVNFKNKRGIQTVLIIPYDYYTAEKEIRDLKSLTKLFTRVYYGFGVDNDLNDNEDLNKVIDYIRDRNVEYQVPNKKSLSPIIYLSGESSDLNHIYNNLMEKRMVYSSSITKNKNNRYIMNISLNDSYRHIISTDIALNPAVSNFTIFVGTRLWELELIGSADAFIIPESIIETFVEEKGFTSNSELINSAKLIPSETSEDYPIQTMKEINIFLNKIYNG